jgi:hypothetical protein
MRLLSLLLCSLSLLACDDPAPVPTRAELGLSSCDAPAEAPAPAVAPTFWRDVEPVLRARCASCHAPGEVGGLTFDTWEQAQLLRDVIAGAVASRRMPPWPPSSCCKDYLHNPSLEPEEIALITAWAAAGGPPGDEADRAPDVPIAAQAPPDVVLSAPVAWRPEPDEQRVDVVRCFALPWTPGRASYVTGFEVAPGERAIVHHALVHAVTGGEAERLLALDAADPAAGWDCFGQSVSLLHAAGLGGWAPGYGPTQYPAGLGFLVPADAVILMQVHYHMPSRAAHRADQTQLRFWLSESVEREAISMGASNPLWLLDGGMQIPAGLADVRHRVWVDPIEAFTDGRPFEIHGLSLHMHAWGAAGTIAVLRSDGSWECLLREDDYDSNWQGQYFLKEPVVVYPGDRVFVECAWDNSAGNQPLVNGERAAPRDLEWGTDQEMCTGFVLGASL